MTAGRREPAPFPDALPALTSVRFLLALGVVLFHYQLQWAWDSQSVTGLLDRARLGVDVFFILSGFVLTHAYRADISSGRRGYRRFLIARVARVYPAHLAVLGFVLAMVGVAAALGAEFDPAFYNPAGFVLTLLLVHAWGPELIKAEWNGPSWSLSAEWFAYLAFPLYAKIGLKLRNRPWLLLGLVAFFFIILDQLYIALFSDTVVHAEINFGILRILPEFLYGVALYRLGESLRLSRHVAVAFSLGASAFLLALMHVAADDRLVVAAAGPMVLSLALLSKVGADQPLARPWMLAAGEASFSLYLVHMPLLIGWKGVHSALKGGPSSSVFAWGEIGALLVLTVAAAFGLHAVVEAPARRWIRARIDQTPRPGSKRVMLAGSQPPDL